MSEKRLWAAFEDYLNGPATRRSNVSGWTFDERFKAWAEREAMTLVTPNNTLGVATSKDMEAAFLGGINSRDAEVQALREENLRYYDLLLEVMPTDDSAKWLNRELRDRITAALLGRAEGAEGGGEQ